MNTQSISLDVSKIPTDAPVIRLRSGDVDGLNLVVQVLDHGAALDISGYTASLLIRLQDTAYEFAGTVDGSTAAFTVDSSDMPSGKTDIAYVPITDGSLVLSTGRFTVEVLESANGAD